MFFFLMKKSLVFGQLSFIFSFLIQLVFFGITEFAPMLSFVYTAHKFVNIVHPQANPDVAPADGNDADADGGQNNDDLAQPLAPNNDLREADRVVA